MNDRVRFFELTMVLPSGWLDVTDDLPTGSPPTLARADGVGALQISIARYRSGSKPNVRAEDLLGLLRKFGDDRGLGAPANANQGRGQNVFVTGDFASAGEFIRVGYVTNGRDIALATYVARETNDEQVAKELLEATAAIASIDFWKRPDPG